MLLRRKRTRSEQCPQRLALQGMSDGAYDDDDKKPSQAATIIFMTVIGVSIGCIFVALREMSGMPSR